MLMSDVDLKSYTDKAYHNEELKSLTRYGFDKVRERAKLIQSVSRQVNFLFRNWKCWCRRFTWRPFMPFSVSSPALSTSLTHI